MGEDAREMLREFLAARDAECPGCGYNLRDLTGTRCPECNQELVLRVGLAEPRLAWFVGGLVGVSMGLGFSAMVFAWAGVVMMFSQFSGPTIRDIVPLVFGTGVGAAVLWWWIRARRRLSGTIAQQRWGRAAVATAAALACPIWFFVTVR